MTPSSCSTIRSAVETSATSCWPSAPRLSRPANWRQVNFERYSLGRCFSTRNPEVAERRKLHDVRDDDRAWQRPRPVRSGQGTKLGSPASSANQCQASDPKLCQRSVSAIGWLEIALRGTNWGSEDRVKITSHSCSIDRCQQPLDFLFHPLALALLSGRARLPRSARSAAL